MFEMAGDFAKFNTEFEVMGGYLSPVSDAYKKAGLASARDRLRMCELAVDQTSNWLMVDPWEAQQPEYVPTAFVLDHFRDCMAEIYGPDRVKIMLLAGADLIQTMSTPGVWSEDDLEHILRGYGSFIVERTGTDIDDALSSLEKYRDNIWIINQLIQNDVSSTKIRLFLRREMSVQYLIPAPVIEYIEEHGLYMEDGTSSIGGRGKSKGPDNSGRTSPAIGSSALKS